MEDYTGMDDMYDTYKLADHRGLDLAAEVLSISRHSLDTIFPSSNEHSVGDTNIFNFLGDSSASKTVNDHVEDSRCVRCHIMRLEVCIHYITVF
jgi:hypothetical protein